MIIMYSYSSWRKNDCIPSMDESVAEMDKFLDTLPKRVPTQRKRNVGPVIVHAPERDIFGNTVKRSNKTRKRDIDPCTSSSSDALLLDPVPQIELHMEPNELETCPSGLARSVFENAKEDLNEFLSEIPFTPSEPKTPRICLPHSDRKRINEDNWADMRPFLFVNGLKQIGQIVGTECSGCEDPAVIRCMDCFVCYCPVCDIRAHDDPRVSWHSRQRFDKGYLQPMEPCVVLECHDDQYIERKLERFLNIESPKTCVACGNDASFEMSPHLLCAYITMKGRFNLYLPKFACSLCSQLVAVDSQKILASGLWPGSLQISFGMYVFHPEVLQTFYFLKMESPSLSRRSFLTTLEQLSLLNGCKDRVSPQPFRTAYNEWMYFQHEMDMFVCNDWMKCPGCHMQTHAVHLDGNKKLYRFKGHNQTSHGNHFKDIFIANDEEVNQFVLKVQSTSVKSDGSTCGETHWKAAKSSSSKRQKALAETGLEVGCCRHGVLVKALNMFRGEIFAYPLYLHHELSLRSKLEYVCQDVICRYWPWLKRLLPKFGSENSLQDLSQTKPFLSVFHAKAHNWTCQVRWGGRWQKGSAAQSGEEMEQANSYLSRAALTTKMMDKAGREEQLTAHALYWNKKKQLSLCKSLCLRYKKSFVKVEQLKAELSKAFADENISNEVNLDAWKADVQEFAATIEGRRTERCIQPHVNDSTLASIQREIEMLSSNIRQLKYDVGKTGDSGRNRTHIRARIEKERKRLEATVKLYNTKSTGPQLLLNDVTGENYIYPWQGNEADDGVSFAIKRKLVDINEHIVRYEEERSVLLLEMKSSVQYLREKVQLLKDKLQLVKSTSSSLEDFGLRQVEVDEVSKMGMQMMIEEAKEKYEDVLAETVHDFRCVLNRNDLEILQEFSDESEDDEDIEEVDSDDESDSGDIE